jgi:hypothetical protein
MQKFEKGQKVSPTVGIYVNEPAEIVKVNDFDMYIIRLWNGEVHPMWAGNLQAVSS